MSPLTEAERTLIANLITLSRLFLLALTVWLLSARSPVSNLGALSLIILMFYLDVLDGQIARKLGQESETGETLDVLADRIIENVLWFWFAGEGFIPLFIPMVVLARGLATDATRVVMTTTGRNRKSATSIDWLATSRLMRGLYGFLKLLTFSCMSLLPIIEQSRDLYRLRFLSFTHLLVAATVLTCLIRSVPIIGAGLYACRRANLSSRCMARKSRHVELQSHQYLSSSDG